MYCKNCFGSSNNDCRFCNFNENKYVTIIYYKCSCGCRVGMSNEYGYKIPKSFISENFYCNNCKKETPHIYCGYKTVEK